MMIISLKDHLLIYWYETMASLDDLPREVWANILLASGVRNTHQFALVSQSAKDIVRGIKPDVVHFLKKSHSKQMQCLYNTFIKVMLPRARFCKAFLHYAPYELTWTAHFNPGTCEYMIPLIQNNPRLCLFDVQISSQCTSVKLIVDGSTIVDMDSHTLSLLQPWSEELPVDSKMQAKGFIRLGNVWSYYPIRAHRAHVVLKMNTDVHLEKHFKVWVLDGPDPSLEIEREIVHIRQIKPAYKVNQTYTTERGIARAILLRTLHTQALNLICVNGITLNASECVVQRLLNNDTNDIANIYSIELPQAVALPATITWSPVSAEVDVFFETENAFTNESGRWQLVCI